MEMSGCGFRSWVIRWLNGGSLVQTRTRCFGTPRAAQISLTVSLRKFVITRQLLVQNCVYFGSVLYKLRTQFATHVIFRRYARSPVRRNCILLIRKILLDSGSREGLHHRGKTKRGMGESGNRGIGDSENERQTRRTGVAAKNAEDHSFPVSFCKVPHFVSAERRSQWLCNPRRQWRSACNAGHNE